MSYYLLCYFVVLYLSKGIIKLQLFAKNFNPFPATHNNCRLLSHLHMSFEIFANNMYPDQTATLGFIVFLHCNIVLKVHLNIHNRGNKQMTFSGPKNIGRILVKSFVGIEGL